jgi:hypothetical protein
MDQMRPFIIKTAGQVVNKKPYFGGKLAFIATQSAVFGIMSESYRDLTLVLPTCCDLLIGGINRPAAIAGAGVYNL